MYPKSFVDLFPAFPRNDEVFVAMSFHPSLSLRYEAVIAPAIKKCGLKPIRVDKTQISDSILTDILKGVTHSLLIFADLTGPSGNASPNVMYEVGLAHALRLPPEVILFRSDSGHPPFDVSNVRLNKYEPEADSDRARQLVVSTISDARREIDSTKHLIVEDLADQLTHEAALTLLAADQPWDVPLQSLEYSYDIPVRDDLRSRLQALLEMRLIQCVFEDSTWTKEMHWLKPMALVRITPLGRAVSTRLELRVGHGRAIKERLKSSVDRDLLSAAEIQFFFSFRSQGYSIPAELSEDEKAQMLAYVKAHAVGSRVHRQSTQIDYLMEKWEKEELWPARRRAEEDRKNANN